ncbi:1-(5-phosphoribosyl)-5-[(5-phosphoribosylamino)methylideneamino]imidazole-4-carboxamide isomerase [Candidatus Bathyarchaeota archaeon]|nr:1-(5-phosphoribosyl)-5-[(5-phosphoribosylamino)methylideneamino]imidazole-4-carboxamide isomerase [Candidatus Bathyarchaeota archaeon]
MIQIIPAIDIMNSKLVRLTKGDPSTRQHYETLDPLSMARIWVEHGADRLHIIDLDAALGKGSNKELILEIAESVEASLQVGGGIRTVETARSFLDMGVECIILGSMPLKDPIKSLKLLDEYGERIILALDHRDGNLMVKGWQETTAHSLREALTRFKEQGYYRFLVTNIEHDGVLKGPDFETYKEISRVAKIIASGGVTSTHDIKRLNKTGVKAVVIGKALYMKRFTLREAMEAGRC